MDPNPWTLYWQADNLQSCIASQFPDDIESIRQFWHLLAENVPANASVLDLASGNGAVPSMLLACNTSLKITAVDLADIEPQRYLSQAPELASVHFLPNTDICHLPFDEASFDAVTSQFGLEYAPIQQACNSAANALCSGGRIQLLLHHQDSDIVSPAGITQAEISSLLAPEGVIEAACAFAAGAIPAIQLEQVGQRYIKSDSIKSPGVSGQIFAGVDQVIQLHETDIKHAEALAHTMRMRLVAEHTRLGQLQNAALSEADIEKTCSYLQQSKIEIEFCEELKIRAADRGDALVGWQLFGSKK